MPAQTIRAVETHLRQLADPERAQIQQRFFKTGPGEYGQGDIFWGIRVPELRVTARRFHQLPLPEITRLLNSGVHEHRLLALFMLIRLFERGADGERKRIYDLYLQHTHRVNNWDLVDASAPAIAGGYLYDKTRQPLYDLARSQDLWERRIAVLATFYFIRRDQFTDTINIAGMLVGDEEDLIHKACGWMLREIGKRDRDIEERFLKQHHRQMPRTMLRYAIEKFPDDLRQAYLKGNI
jgi:3-methyladenine DNA glycosylase AlkD